VIGERKKDKKKIKKKIKRNSSLVLVQARRLKTGDGISERK
jgi:hypothetical protein